MSARKAEDSRAGCCRSSLSLGGPSAQRRGVQCCVHNHLGLTDNRVQMDLVLEAFRVDLIDAFRTRRSRRKPAAGGHDLQPTYRGVVAGGAGQLSKDRLAI